MVKGISFDWCYGGLENKLNNEKQWDDEKSYSEIRILLILMMFTYLMTSKLTQLLWIVKNLLKCLH